MFVSCLYKNYSALLFKEIIEPFLEMKLLICDLLLEIYVFSRNEWALGSREVRKLLETG